MIALYDPQRHNPHAIGTPYDPGVVSLSYTARILWLIGYPDRALKRIQEALALARKLSHPFSLSFAIGVAVLIHQYRREGRATQEQAEAAIALSSEQGFAFWGATATLYQGWSLAEQGHEEEGLVHMREGLAALRDQAAGGEMEMPACYALLAETYGQVGRIEEGMTVLTEAFAVVDKTGVCYYEADVTTQPKAQEAAPGKWTSKPA